ncbi:hypothetical protein Dimus_027997 [Dionaea muscipula]
MDTSLSILISNYHCSNSYLLPNVRQCFPSPSLSRKAKVYFNAQSSSKIDQNLAGKPVKPQYSIKSLDFNHGSKSPVFSLFATQCTLSSPTRVVTVEDEKHLSNAAGPSLPLNGKDDLLPRIDKSGKFCSPRAARELALSIVYAACLEGCDPVRLLDRRLNAPREPGYEFDKACLLRYNHMSFSGPVTTTDTLEEADELLRKLEEETAIEAEVLSAPPKLVYSKLLLRLTRKLLVAVQERWDDNVLVINQVAPKSWKDEPAGRILEFSILHLAMSEISVLGAPHPVVINEAVDLAKRFCDGGAPRVINGCLSTFINGFGGGNPAVIIRPGKKVFL